MEKAGVALACCGGSWVCVSAIWLWDNLNSALLTDSTYGDYYFTAWGLILTLLGTFLAALKTVTTNLIQTGGGGRLKLVSWITTHRETPD